MNDRELSDQDLECVVAGKGVLGRRESAPSPRPRSTSTASASPTPVAPASSGSCAGGACSA